MRFGHPYRRLLPYLVNIIMEAFQGVILCVHNLSCYYNCRNRLSYTICVSHLSIYRHGVICIPVFIFLNELSLAVQLSALMLYKLDISIITSKGCLFLLLHWRQVTHLFNNYYPIFSGISCKSQQFGKSNDLNVLRARKPKTINRVACIG